jgi:hypothetical protein
LAVHGDRFWPEGNDNVDSVWWSRWLALGSGSIRRTTRSSRRWLPGRRRTTGGGSPGAAAGPDGEKQRAQRQGGYRDAGARRADGTGVRRRVMVRHGTVQPDVRRCVWGAQLASSAPGGSTEQRHVRSSGARKEKVGHDGGRRRDVETVGGMVKHQAVRD